MRSAERVPDSLPPDTPPPDATTQEDGAPLFQVEGYEGPLDVLLEQARRQQVDLSRLSLSALVEQFVIAMETVRTHSSLSQRGHWLVMMTGLVLLRSRLLLPVAAAEQAEARQEVDDLRQHLVLRQQLEQAAFWLERRPRLGRDVFARGAPELRPVQRHSGPAALLEACLTVLTQSERHLEKQKPAPRIPYWTVQDALARMRTLLPALPEGSLLADYLPEEEPVTPADDRPAAVQLWQRKAAIAGTLIASLEMTKQGVLVLEQADIFAGIYLRMPMPQSG